MSVTPKLLDNGVVSPYLVGGKVRLGEVVEVQPPPRRGTD
jgi:hypothetical protein